MKVNVRWWFWESRSAYHIRCRGWQYDERGQRATRIDSITIIPDVIFEREHVPLRRKTSRADTIAANYAAAKRREIEQETTWRPKRMTIEEIGEMYLRKRRSEVVSATIERDGLMIKQLVAFFGDRDPATMTIAAMEDYRDARLKHEWVPRLGVKGIRSISPRTVANECAFARQLLRWAYARKDQTGMSRLELHDVPEVLGKRRTRGRILTIAEFWLAYEKAALRPRVGRRSQRMLALGIATWIRKDPLTNLDARWIDWNDATVTIPAEYMKGRDGEKRPLTLPLCRFAMAHLDSGVTTGCVWGVNRRTNRPATNLFHTIAAIAADAGIRPFSLHDLRRTGNTILLNHRCETCRSCGTVRADHRDERCVNGGSFAATHPQGVPKQIRDKILAHSMPANDEAYTSIDIETMRDALSIIDEEWSAHLAKQGSNVLPFKQQAQ